MPENLAHRPGSYDGAGTMPAPPAAGATTLDTPVFHDCPRDPACPYCAGAVGEARALDWSFLDGVYCISLKSREDRAINVSAQFHRLGLCRRVSFYRPLKHPERGIVGSWESHRAVAEHARSRGYARTLILEDDVQFVDRLSPRSVRAIARAVTRLPPDWMIFFLGHWPLWAYFVRHNVLRTSSACAHAYIASPRLLDWLHEHPWGSPGIEKRRLVGKALDSAYAMLPATYALFPMIATQSISRSDNVSVRHKKNTRLRHIVTHSKHREWLLSRLMRPFEVVAVALSPLSFVARASVRWYKRAGRWIIGSGRAGDEP